MTVVDETWYKELEDQEFCAGLHTVDAVDITQLMKELYKDSDGVPQFINTMEEAQRK